MKHLRITVGEQTYGLPLLLLLLLFIFFCDSGHDINPIKYKILKRIDSHLLPCAILWECLIIFHHKFRHSKDSFILIHQQALAKNTNLELCPSLIQLLKIKLIANTGCMCSWSRFYMIQPAIPPPNLAWLSTKYDAVDAIFSTLICSENISL